MIVSDIKKMPRISEILSLVDRHGVVGSFTNRWAHKVAYSNTRTILSYVEKDARPAAYACNPGNAVLILQKKKGMIAYGCYFEGFPQGDQYSQFLWKKMKVEKALSLIEQEFWLDAGYVEGLNYEDTSYSAEWPLLTCGKIQYISSYAGNNANITVEEYLRNKDHHSYTSDFSIRRLKSGKLRVELNGSHFDYEQIVDVITFFDENLDTDKQRVGRLPSMGSWRKVISITEIEKDISRELKAQLLIDKMKEAV